MSCKLHISGGYRGADYPSSAVTRRISQPAEVLGNHIPAPSKSFSNLQNLQNLPSPLGFKLYVFLARELS